MGPSCFRSIRRVVGGFSAAALAAGVTIAVVLVLTSPIDHLAYGASSEICGNGVCKANKGETCGAEKTKRFAPVQSGVLRPVHSIVSAPA